MLTHIKNLISNTDFKITYNNNDRCIEFRTKDQSLSIDVYRDSVIVDDHNKDLQIRIYTDTGALILWRWKFKEIRLIYIPYKEYRYWYMDIISILYNRRVIDRDTFSELFPLTEDRP